MFSVVSISESIASNLSDDPTHRPVCGFTKACGQLDVAPTSPDWAVARNDDREIDATPGNVIAAAVFGLAPALDSRGSTGNPRGVGDLAGSD